MKLVHIFLEVSYPSFLTGIDEWLRISGSCPYCKHGIEEKKKNNNEENEADNNGNTDENV